MFLFCSVNDVWEIESEDVVTCDDVWVFGFDDVFKVLYELFF